MGEGAHPGAGLWLEIRQLAGLGLGGMDRPAGPQPDHGPRRPGGSRQIHDRGRGSNFTAAFEEILADAGIRTVLCNVRTSCMNAIAERWIRDAAANSWTAPSLLAAAPGRSWQAVARQGSRGETDVLRWRYVVIRKAWRLLIPAVLGLLIHFTSVSPSCGEWREEPGRP